MDVRCDRCQTEYELEDESVSDGGASVQCTSCGHTFVVSRGGRRGDMTPTPGPTPGPATASVGTASPWMLTTEEGKTHRFRDSTTLQKWIVERRVGRTDRVCPPGGSWRRLGEMDELRPFFEVVDQADRTAAARSASRPTRPETPRRLHTGGQPYASPDEDDDDILTSDQRARGSRGRQAHPGRFNTDVTAAIGIDDSLSMDIDILKPRRTFRKVFGGVVILGLAAGAAYLGVRDQPGRSSEAKSIATAPVPAPAPPPKPAAPAPAPAKEPPTEVKEEAAQEDTKEEKKEAKESADVAAESAKAPAKEAAKEPKAPTAAATASARPRRYEQLVADADRALENGNTVKAQKLFDEALKLQPNGVAAVTGAAYLLLDKQKPLAAIGMFKRALASAPSFPQALFGLGEAYRHQGDPAHAVEAYKRYLSAAPGGSDAPAARRQIRELEEQLTSRRQPELLQPAP